ncbi:amino acid--tRNA ligase-related protein [Bacillus paranthracis]
MKCYLLLLKKKGLHPDKFQSYLNTFRYGCPPHGGFGIGLERVVCKLLELTNVREASAFPRDCTRLIP